MIGFAHKFCCVVLNFLEIEFANFRMFEILGKLGGSLGRAQCTGTHNATIWIGDSYQEVGSGLPICGLISETIKNEELLEAHIT
jgi:hypothetical protein